MYTKSNLLLKNIIKRKYFQKKSLSSDPHRRPRGVDRLQRQHRATAALCSPASDLSNINTTASAINKNINVKSNESARQQESSALYLGGDKYIAQSINRYNVCIID